MPCAVTLASADLVFAKVLNDPSPLPGSRNQMDVFCGGAFSLRGTYEYGLHHHDGSIFFFSNHLTHESASGFGCSAGTAPYDMGPNYACVPRGSLLGMYLRYTSMPPVVLHEYRYS